MFGLLLAVVLLRAAPVVAAGVVGTGAPESCTDAALDIALSGGGLVTFNCGSAPVTIDISTGTGTKTISTDTTVDGGGLITISGGHSVGVFCVNTVTFTVQNLTIANGYSVSPTAVCAGRNIAGGGIDNYEGTLTVTNSTFSGNRVSIYNYSRGTLTVANGTFSGNEGVWILPGGIANGGMATVTNSTFSGNKALVGGGGIGNSGMLTVIDSTFSGNTDSGIYNDGTLTVTNGTFSGNAGGQVNPQSGGGIRNFGTLSVTNSTFSGNTANDSGGGIYNYSGTLTVTNSTFSGNTAAGTGGGILNDIDSTLTVTNSTFSGNASSESGGGIFNYYGGGGGTLIVTNTIIVNSVGGNCAGAEIADGGHNIDDGTTCGFTGAGCTSIGGSSFCNTNPQLDPAGLADNGGPTQTIALEPDSPAINAGDSEVCDKPPVNGVDQRGFVRPGEGAMNCSIGAYEYAAGPTTTTTTTVPTTTLPGCAQLPQASLEGAACVIEKIRAMLNAPPQPACTCRRCALEPALDRITGRLTQADTAAGAKTCRRSLKAARRATMALRRKVASLNRRKCLAPVDRVASLRTAVADLSGRITALSKSRFCASR